MFVIKSGASAPHNWTKVSATPGEWCGTGGLPQNWIGIFPRYPPMHWGPFFRQVAWRSVRISSRILRAAWCQRWLPNLLGLGQESASDPSFRSGWISTPTAIVC